MLRLLAAMDANGDGVISWAEFVADAPRLIAQAYKAEPAAATSDWCRLPVPGAVVVDVAVGRRAFWYNKRSRGLQWAKPEAVMAAQRAAQAALNAPPDIRGYLRRELEAADAEGLGVVEKHAFMDTMQVSSYTPTHTHYCYYYYYPRLTHLCFLLSTPSF